MKSRAPRELALAAIVLSTALVACGSSGNGNPGTGGSNRGGTMAGGTSGGPSSSGGTSTVTGSGGALTAGGTTGTPRATGGTAGTTSQASGGQSGSGAAGSEPPSTGGQSGRATGGSTQTGGAGGQAGRATGGSMQTGGVTGTGGQPSTGGQGGRATGGATQTGPATGGAGQTGTGGPASGGATGSCTQPANPKRVIAFGTTLDPQAQMCESQQLAKSLANPSSPQWRAKGDQHRSYRFPAANATVAYRICIPATWDGTSKLPMVMFLHSGFGNENTNLDENNGLLVNLAAQYGYALVSPLGYQGAYGNFLALPAVFGQPAAAAEQIAAITSASERTNQLSEKDVINVLEIVLNEYPIDRGAMFLTGHSMGGGGTWYIGAKYPSYWTAFSTLSGPFVQESGYLWDNIRPMPNFITEGTDTAGLVGSRAVRDYMQKNGFKVEYKEVVADHGGMIPIVLPDVFKFFDSHRAVP